MPVYRGRTAGTWRVVISSRGQQREEIVRGAKREALAREAELRLLAPRPSEVRAGLTLAQWCLGPYLSAQQARVRASTCIVRRQALLHLLPHLGSVRLADLTTADLDRAAAARLGEVAQSTTRRDLSVLRHALRLAAEAGHRVGQCRVRLPPAQRSQARAYSDGELLRLFAAADRWDAEFGRLVRWLVLTGLRRGEALAARRQWIDGQDLHIPDPDPVTGWRPKSGPRTVPLCAASVRLLRSPVDKLWRWGRWPDDQAERVWADAGLDGMAHRLRHTFASKFLSIVPDLWLLGRVMGHRNTATTEIYLHMIPGRLEQARGVVQLPAKTMALSLAEPA